ncbi:hypothetical protein CspeluHIS016_0303840 [Cutaneotrichosporon spelunceum]|uniref:Uncharacterized protein n=1 Tax=Cutaneotrichosporon spelunceum TaxID=1672016 RepID=A0AAD3YC74_9TREE|nr:hypothetical protein CspeluHIS016_0303840 [Cutaneotrichosporon spelunceum]
MSSSQIGPISQQYAAAATVPLIKSPSLWLPPPIELPSDIHPLPEDITAYFVYPFTLEQHVISQQPPPHVAIAERRARNAAILHSREVEEEEREKAALHKVAPGYNPAAMLVPTHRGGSAPTVASLPQQSPKKEADPMEELVAQLEEMESSK